MDLRINRAILALCCVLGTLLIHDVACAQSNQLGLTGTVPASLRRGQTVTLTGTIQAYSPAAKTTALQANLVFDPKIFTVSFAPSRITDANVMALRNTLTTFQVPNSSSTGAVTAWLYAAGLLNGVTGKGAATLKGTAVYGTFTLTVRPDAPAGTTTFGYSSAVLSGATLKTANSSLLLTSPAARTTYLNGAWTVQSAGY